MFSTFYYCLLPIFVVLFISLVLINKIVKIENVTIKYPEIDGIRGYLAFFVFLHHSYIWYFFLRTNKWEEPKSNLYNLFGQASVALFFMITAFLFTNKLIQSKEKILDWNKYLISRVYRLLPAYVFSIIFVFSIVLILSNFNIYNSITTIFYEVLNWIFFTFAGPLEINSIKNTYLIDAGVTWSLPYEWMFYLVLPLIGLFFKIKIGLKNFFIFIVLFMLIAFLNHASLKLFIPFFGGIMTAFCVENKFLNFNFKKYHFSLLLIGLVILIITFFHSGRELLPLLFIMSIFFIIASGNSVFGLLSNSLSRKFGQITYSLYLLHGIVLFIVFKFLIGFEKASKLTITQHWAIITCCIFPIILISQLSYKYIELPFLNKQKQKNK